MALALDGSNGVIVTSSSTTAAVTLSTAQSNDVIVLVSEANGVSQTGSTAHITSISAGTLSFTNRVLLSLINNQSIELWYAVAASPLSALSITATYGTSIVATMCAFGISGANTTTIVDPNGVLPVNNNTAADPTFSTTDANTFVIGWLRFGSIATPTAGTGWTAIYAPTNGYGLLQYQIFSAPQSGTTCNVGTGSGGENGSVVDAVIAGAASTAYPLPSQIYIMP